MGSVVKFQALIVASSVAILFCGCGASRPSDAQAHEIVENLFSDIKKLGAGPLTDFTKSNGESLERFGQKVYVYHFMAATKLPEGVSWFKGGSNPTNGISVNEGKFVEDDYFDTRLGTVFTQKDKLPVGTTAVRRGQITFRLTEKGWIAPGGAENVETGYCTQLEPSNCYKELGYDKLR